MIGDRVWQRGLLTAVVVMACTACALDGKAPGQVAAGLRTPKAVQRQPGGPEYLGPQLAVGRKGELYLFWMAVEWRKSWDILFSRSDDDGATWTPPLSLKPDKDTVAGGAQLAAGMDGDVYAVWRQWDVKTKLRRIVLRRSRDGGRHWDERPQELAASRDLGFPSLFVERNEGLVVTWSDGPRSGRYLEVVASQDIEETAAATPVRLTAGLPDSKYGITNVHLASDRTGYIYAVWEEEKTQTQSRIYLNRSSDYGRTWAREPILVAPLEGNPEKADGVEGSPRMPRIVAAPGGRVYLLWEQFETRTVAAATGRPVIKLDRALFFTRSLDAGQSWLAHPIRLTKTPEASSDALATDSAQLGHDEKGNVYAVWIEGESPQQARLIFSRSRDFGATWQSQVQLEQTSPLDAVPVNPLIRNDQAGHLWVFWYQRSSDPRGWQLMMNRSDNYGRTWLSKAVPVGPPTQPWSGIRGGMALNGDDGRLFMVWDGGRQSYEGISFQRSDDFGMSFLPEEVSVAEP